MLCLHTMLPIEIAGVFRYLLVFKPQGNNAGVDFRTKFAITPDNVFISSAQFCSTKSL